MKDSRGSDGYMYHTDGPVIKDAIKEQKITENDTWDSNKQRLITNLRTKGVNI